MTKSKKEGVSVGASLSCPRRCPAWTCFDEEYWDQAQFDAGTVADQERVLSEPSVESAFYVIGSGLNKSYVQAIDATGEWETRRSVSSIGGCPQEGG